MMALTFLAILSGAGIALAWLLVAPPVLAWIGASPLGRALHSRAALAVLLVLPFAAIAATIALNGRALWSAAESATAPTNPALDEARKEAPHDLDQAVKQLEARLAADPNDQDGWRLLARSYTELGQTEKAAEAARRAAALGAPGSDAEALSARGEDLVTANGGNVGADARQSFQAALAADPGDPRARFFLGLAAAQDGNNDDALGRWLALERDSPPDAPWLEGLRSNIGRLAKEMGLDDTELAARRSQLAKAAPPAAAAAAPTPPQAASATAPGPSAADVAAAANMSPDDRTAMIKTMVQRLADKMAQTPGDVDGWLRLGRAYAVLGEQQKSLDAYRHASEADPSREDARTAYAQARAAAGGSQ
jgi:cytochrome c-type biogenesis protein CcmH